MGQEMVADRMHSFHMAAQPRKLPGLRPAEVVRCLSSLSQRGGEGIERDQNHIARFSPESLVKIIFAFSSALAR